MLAVAAIERATDVLADHVADPTGSFRAVEQVLGKRCGRHLGDVFVLRDGENLLLGEATERDAVFEGDHDETFCRARAPSKQDNPRRTITH
jgi:hypothetical protein